MCESRQILTLEVWMHGEPWWLLAANALIFTCFPSCMIALPFKYVCSPYPPVNDYFRMTFTDVFFLIFSANSWMWTISMKAKVEFSSLILIVQIIARIRKHFYLMSLILRYLVQWFIFIYWIHVSNKKTMCEFVQKLLPSVSNRFMLLVHADVLRQSSREELL